MPLFIKLQNGVGHLALNTDDSPAAAELNGWIDFIVDPKNDEVRERHDLKAWIKRRHESEPWFALSCRGLPGVLRSKTMSRKPMARSLSGTSARTQNSACPPGYAPMATASGT